MKKTISLVLVLVLWAGLTAFAWVKPPAASSDSERRPLEQFPEVSGESLLSGQFMKDFADYAVDQFPLRDGFRTLNAYLTYYLLGKQDNNGIYLSDGYAAKMEYPLNEMSIGNAVARFNELYEMYLTDCDVRFALVPDKSYYLAEDAGVLAMDYDALYTQMAESLSWAEFIDLREYLTIADYYRTDTHWRQERLIPAARAIAAKLGVTVPEFREVAVDRPFYGVYYGQAALPMEPETMYLMQSDVIAESTVYDHATGKTVPVYNPAMLTDKDQYNIYLGGPQSLLMVTNPNATTDRELVIFRDSFGSSLAPLLLQSYKTVTLVDIRYIQPEMLGRFLEFNDQDVLFMYSALVLNKNLI